VCESRPQDLSIPYVVDHFTELQSEVTFSVYYYVGIKVNSTTR